MVHSLINVIYDAAFKQCSNNMKIKSVNNDNTSAIAIGITPQSSSVM
jgi:hypothetical protein